jgi:CHASE3 domain sensor protein
MLLSRQSGKIHYRVAVLGAFALVLMLIIGSGLLVWRNAQAQDETAALVIRSHAILGALNQMEMTMADAETGQRGFLLTGEEHFLEPWLAATGKGKVPVIRRPPIGNLFASMRAQEGLTDVERELLERAEGLVADKLAELQQTIDMRRAGRLDEALTVVREGRGKRIMDAPHALHHARRAAPPARSERNGS